MDQPALKHPLLKNHIIQETPSHMVKTEEEGLGWQVWHATGTTCPHGSIPIRRFDTNISHTKYEPLVPNAADRATRAHQYGIAQLKRSTNLWNESNAQCLESGRGITGRFQLGTDLARVRSPNIIKPTISTWLRRVGRFTPTDIMIASHDYLRTERETHIYTLGVTTLIVDLCTLVVPLLSRLGCDCSDFYVWRRPVRFV